MAKKFVKQKMTEKNDAQNSTFGVVL
ncbi:uncharacterized protein G2W53_030571 [Senna tora]|uniref:Uncharacterized protein n=1 Tax=Senna tora TaxID=362788 RepID=A0A834T9D4_9FABA|nr:uncharacterized protein G2W53_030571 [Senna tora]